VTAELAQADILSEGYWSVAAHSKRCFQRFEPCCSLAYLLVRLRLCVG
jgi:hypothetical protein